MANYITKYENWQIKVEVLEIKAYDTARQEYVIQLPGRKSTRRTVRSGVVLTLSEQMHFDTIHKLALKKPKEAPKEHIDSCPFTKGLICFCPVDPGAYGYLIYPDEIGTPQRIESEERSKQRAREANNV